MNRRRLALLLAILPAACGGSEPSPKAGGDATAVPHFAWLSSRVARGAQPEGEASFAFLAAQGIRTLISVDGARPDVEAAARHGLRYVHIPFGYDQVPAEERRHIAKTVRELEGPFFIHCHHGRHRGPAAAAIAEQVLGGMTCEEAKEELVRAGTDPRYEGLYRSVTEFRAPGEEETRADPFDFPAVAPVPALAEAMVALDRRMDGLKAARAAGWKPPPDHPDIAPAHEALQAEELLAEMARLPEAAEFPALLGESLLAARALRAALDAPIGPAEAETAYRRLTQSCSACHSEHRDR
ncbi:MAG: hypothetical protein MUE73_05950 [Planctomycetes bacterium]|nr:hypothetical protein [Planctomycetota bacterium]